MDHNINFTYYEVVIQLVDFIFSFKLRNCTPSFLSQYKCPGYATDYLVSFDVMMHVLNKYIAFIWCFLQ